MSKTDPLSYTRSWSPDGEIAFFTLSDGARLRYLKTGKGPALVLLHTLRTQLDYFQRLIPLLANRFTIYAIDYPALGWSDIRRGAGYDEPDLRKAVVEFVEGLDLKDLTLVGESMGATLSLTASTELGERVRQIVALNSYDYPQGVERANALAWFIVKMLRTPIVGLMFSKLSNPMILGGIMRGGFYDGRKLPEDFVREQLRSAKRPGYASAETKYFRSLPSFIAARSLYPRVKAPATLVYGDHDWSRPEERKQVAQLIPGSRFITLPNTGHFSALERPEEVARIVIDEASARSRSYGAPREARRPSREAARGDILVQANDQRGRITVLRQPAHRHRERLRLRPRAPPPFQAAPPGAAWS
ncbi:MAG: alpha/beta hydrolase [Hyphomicrobiales bacterium]